MSEVLRRFEHMVHTYKGSGGDALRAAAKKHPVGYTMWIRQQVAGTPYTAEGFDLARGKLEAAGLGRAEALRQTAREHPAHGLWIAKFNEDRRSQKEKNRGQEAPAAAPAVAPVQTLTASPAVVAAPLLAASGRQPDTGPALSAEKLAAQRARWEKFPAVRAAFGDDFSLLIACAEGRKTLDEVRALREATAGKESRAILASWAAGRQARAALNL